MGSWFYWFSNCNFVHTFALVPECKSTSCNVSFNSSITSAKGYAGEASPLFMFCIFCWGFGIKETATARALRIRNRNLNQSTCKIEQMWATFCIPNKEINLFFIIQQDNSVISMESTIMKQVKNTALTKISTNMLIIITIIITIIIIIIIIIGKF